MVKIDFPICCYTNGELVVDGENVSYNNGVESFVIVNSDISFNNLYNLIGSELEVDLVKFKLDIKLKFPSLRGYKVIKLNNDKVLSAMWASVYQTNAPSIDLFVDFTPLEPTIETGHTASLENNTTFTNLLTQVMRGGDVGGDENREVVACDDFVGDDVVGDETIEGMNHFLLNDLVDDEVDIVSQSAPIPEYTKLYDVEPLSSYGGKKIVSFEKDGEFCVNQRFKNKETLTKLVKLYHVERNQTCFTKESKPHTVTFVCNRVPNACTWYLRASKKDLGDAFTIVTYKGPHETSCVGDKIQLDHPNLNSSIISDAIRKLVEADWGLTPTIIQAAITREYHFTISYRKAWKAKQKAMADIFGNWESSYELLPRYLQAMKESNPGTQFHIVSNDIGSSEYEEFDRVFWAFGPSIRGFKHCRPIITIDGTHLYAKYKGVLLIAMGVDAEDQIYPLAYAIVTKESVDTWSWFLHCVRVLVTRRQGLCVISDRHIGIVRAMKEVGSGWEEPHAYHRYCIRHQASNVNTNFKCTKLKDLFTETAEERQIKKFGSGMERIGEYKPNAKAYLDKIPKRKWSIANDGGYRYGIKTSNHVECFNGVLKNVRALPITALVQATFYRVNAYFFDRRTKTQSRILNGNRFSNRVLLNIGKRINKATQHKVERYNREEGIYGVITGRKNISHTVNLLAKTCACNKWQIYHVPCSHLMAVCMKEKLEYGQFIDPYFSSEQHHASYKPSFIPVPDESYWEPYTGKKVIPNPELKRGDGRPKASRIPNEMDNPSQEKRRMSCSICQGKGHNKRSCPSKGSSSST